MTERGASSEPVPRLDLLKALGDRTRYAIYLELARSSLPLATADVAESLGLHPNTVRPHLERMREVGLLDVEIDARGAVGRPQHRYSLAAEAPSLGLEPPAFPMLARMLLQAAVRARVPSDDALSAGRTEGRTRAQISLGGRRSEAADDPPVACVDALVAELDRLGFDPATGDDGSEVTIAFAHCPYQDLAEAAPELVCSLHQGLVEGFVAGCGGARVLRFNSLIDREPCRVSLRRR